EAVILGFQHFIVMLGTTVIIPSALFLKWEGNKFLRTMRGTQGALIIASTIQIILGFSGLWRNVAGLLSPLSAVPLVSLVGFGLYELGFPAVSSQGVEIGLPELILMVAFSQVLQHFYELLTDQINVFKCICPCAAFWEGRLCRFSFFFTVSTVWFHAYILTISGAYKNVRSRRRRIAASIVRGLSEELHECFAMMMTSFIAIVESTGAFIAASRYASATMIPPSIVSRGIGWQGIGILLDSFFGTANGTSVANVGLLVVTHVGSRRVVQISAGFMIFFAVLGKFGALFASIPLPIFAGMYCVFFAYVGACGLSLQFCNLNSFRTKFILASPSSSAYRCRSISTSTPFNDMINVPFSNKPFVAGLVAYFLDNTMHLHQSAVRKDRGYHWWDKFRSFKKDARSEEFYSLPFNLNKFFLRSDRAMPVVGKRAAGPLVRALDEHGPASLICRVFVVLLRVDFVYLWTKWTCWTGGGRHVRFLVLRGSTSISYNLLLISLLMYMLLS
ncbi:hypothetical protein ZWY2020_008398, partial [Hordeum vulgare]